MSFLILADGSLFAGRSVGISSCHVGELVFNTSHLGYQEILTDPSYFGQIITFTNPHIGNIGINAIDYESTKVHAAGAVFRKISQTFSHWQGNETIRDFLARQQIVALDDVDTRALTLHLRTHGSQPCCLVADGKTSPKEAIDLLSQRLIKEQSVSAANPYVYKRVDELSPHIVVIDCGVKLGILERLKQYPVNLTVVPHHLCENTIGALKPDGVLLSNGPGDPRAYPHLIAMTRDLLADKIPIFGICLGHQLLALAGGGAIKKMKSGHHGANHPIQCLQTGAVLISSQNHSYVVDEDCLPPQIKVTHRSLFDGTIAGITFVDQPAFSFQGHPEANPGPRELAYLFKQFIKEVQSCLKTT